MGNIKMCKKLYSCLIKEIGVLYKNNYKHYWKFMEGIWAFIECRRIFLGEEKA